MKENGIKRWDILGFGSAAVDDLVYVSSFPRPNSKARAAQELQQGGGLTATALVAAARQGVSTVYAGVLGDNEQSRYVMQEFEKEGVDTSPVLFKPAAHPYHSTIIVDQSNGQRTILSSHNGWIERKPEEIDEALIRSCRMLFLDHTVVDGGLKAAYLAQKLGIPTIGDFEAIRSEKAAELMQQINHLIIGRTLAEQVTRCAGIPEMLAALFIPGRHCVVVTEGEKGSWFLTQAGHVEHVAAFSAQVVDTTGCGDVFHGVYAARLVSGSTIREAIVAASAAAALKACRPGGREGIPTRAAVDAFLAGKTNIPLEKRSLTLCNN